MNLEELQSTLDHVLTPEEVAVLTDESRRAMATAWEAARLVVKPNLFMQIKHALGSYTWEHLGNPEHPWDASEATRVVFNVLGITPPEIQSDPRPADPPTPPPGKRQG